MVLRQHLLDLIKTKGPISIEEFMQVVMTSTANSYYVAKQPIGIAGDFITAPEISQIFGETIGVWVILQWQKLQSPAKFHLIELGPGRGTLMRDVLRSTTHVPGFHEAIQLTLIECNPYLRSLQQEMFSPTSWLNHLYEFQAQGLPLILLANEFFDALPIKQYIKSRNSWQEIMVTTTLNTDFTFTKRPLAEAESKFLNCDYAHVQEGEVVEIAPQANKLCKLICELLKDNGGASLIIDYGYYRNRYPAAYHSTLQAVKNHAYHPILQNLGEADISAHVDFDQLVQIVETTGLETWSLSTQKEFLFEYGINLRLQQLLLKANLDQKLQLSTGYDRLVNATKMGFLFKALQMFNAKII